MRRGDDDAWDLVSCASEGFIASEVEKNGLGRLNEEQRTLYFTAMCSLLSDTSSFLSYLMGGCLGHFKPIEVAIHTEQALNRIGAVEHADHCSKARKLLEQHCTDSEIDEFHPSFESLLFFHLNEDLNDLQCRFARRNKDRILADFE